MHTKNLHIYVNIHVNIYEVKQWFANNQITWAPDFQPQSTDVDMG